MEPDNKKTISENDPELIQFTEKNLNQAHTVLWFDPKMKNYQLFVEYLEEQVLTHAKINVILVVDKHVHLTTVKGMWAEQYEKDQAAASQVITFN